MIDISTEDKKLVPQIYALSSRFEVENTEMNVYGAQAYVSDKKHKEHFAELFKLSMENARWKAEMYAEGAGRKLGAVMQMSDKVSRENLLILFFVLCSFFWGGRTLRTNTHYFWWVTVPACILVYN